MIDYFVVEGFCCDVFFYFGGNDFVCYVVCLGLLFIVGDEEIEMIVCVFCELFDVVVVGFY